MQLLLQQSEPMPLNQEEREVLSRFAAGTFTYFDAKTGFNSDNLDLCVRAMGLLQYAHAQLSARAKKDYLEWQAEMLLQ